jgi:hypothetical protein
MYRNVGYVVGAVAGSFAVAYGYQSQYQKGGHEDVQVLKAVTVQDLQKKTENNEGGFFPVNSSVRTAVYEKQNLSINDAIVKARELAYRRKDEVGAPGIVIGVSINGKTVWEEGKRDVSMLLFHLWVREQIIIDPPPPPLPPRTAECRENKCC